MRDIGGWNTDTCDEDTCASLMLLGAKYKVRWLPGLFQVGEVPESLLGFIMQKTRWVSRTPPLEYVRHKLTPKNTGNIQNAVKIRWRLYGDASKHCTPSQRLSGFVFGTSVLLMTFWPFVFVALASQLLSEQSMVAYSDRHQLRSLLRLASAESARLVSPGVSDTNHRFESSI